MHPVLVTVLQRLALGLATLVAVSIIIFISIEMLPGDFGQIVLGQAATKDTVAAFRAELGLDMPAYLRYFDWIAGVLQGDLGTSFSGRAASGQDRSREVAELIGPRLQNTLFLAGITALISVPLALILGISTALYRNTIYDRSINAATLTTISFPEFFVAYILILFLSSLNQWLPSLANVDASTPLGERLTRIALPALTLTLVGGWLVCYFWQEFLRLPACPFVRVFVIWGQACVPQTRPGVLLLCLRGLRGPQTPQCDC